MKEKPMSLKTFFVQSNLCSGCRLCQLVCSVAKEGIINPELSRVFVNRIIMDGVMLPHICLNCEEPPCIPACHRKAINKDPNTGWVTIDYERCTHCQLCIPACPYGGILLGPQKEVLMCDVCGGDPACAMACPTGALRFLGRETGTAGEHM
jgi:Fe-S-cluster-containing hydrogenase component 2